jgi:hypothetical protein
MQQNVSSMVRWGVAQSLYLRSTFCVGDRTRLRKRTTEETQTLWPICGTSVHPKFRWRQINRRLTSVRWQFKTLRGLSFKRLTENLENQRHFFKLFPGDTFARWRTASESFAVGRPILARQLLTTLSGGLLRWTTLLAKLIGGHFSFFTVDTKTLSSVANWP